MKKLLTTATILLALSASVNAQTEKEFEIFVAEQHKTFSHTDDSPLTEEDRKNFESINYFDFNPNFVVEAVFTPSKKAERFEMQTSTDRQPIYVKRGTFMFDIAGKSYKLEGYQNVEYILKNPEKENELFVPFNDLTNGEQSYGGGRYMEVLVDERSEKVILDFNQTYHPYCAYNYKYSCPIPPKQNDLQVHIEAGVMLGLNGVIPEQSPAPKSLK